MILKDHSGYRTGNELEWLRLETGRPAARSLEQEVWVTDTKPRRRLQTSGEFRGRHGRQTGRSCWLPDSRDERHEKRMISRPGQGH